MPGLYSIVLVGFAGGKVIVIGNIKLLMRFKDRIFEQLRHTLSDLVYIFLGEEVFVSQAM